LAASRTAYRFGGCLDHQLALFIFVALGARLSSGNGESVSKVGFAALRQRFDA